MAELQVLAGGGIAAPLNALAEAFARQSGFTPVYRFGTTPELVALATGGGPFDVAVTPAEVHRDAAARARFAPGAPIGIARVGLGVAVRAGAPKPAIDTPEAFRAAMLAARSIAAIPASAGGAQVTAVFEGLGIRAEMDAKTLAQPGPPALIAALAGGAAELGVFLANVFAAPGIELVGPFPAPLQREVAFVGTPAADPAQPAVAQAFLDFLRGTEAQAVIRAKGMVPG